MRKSNSAILHVLFTAHVLIPYVWNWGMIKVRKTGKIAMIYAN